MKRKMKNKIWKGSLGLVLVGLMVVMFSGFALGYGVISEYTKNRPLQLEPGDTVETYLKILNTGEGIIDDIRVKVEITDEDSIASFSDRTIYDLKGGEIVRIPISVTAPSVAALGTEHIVTYKISSIPLEEGEGTISFGIGYEGGFKVLVVEFPDEEETPPVNDTGGTDAELSAGSIWVWVIAIVIILVVLVVAFGMKKGESKVVRKSATKGKKKRKKK